MTKEQFDELKEMVKQVQSINSKLDSIINQMDNKSDSQELKERGIINGLLHICTHKEYSDKEYCDALRQLSQLPFGLSSKQLAWILVYCGRHHQSGEQIELFIRKQFEKAKDKNEYIQQVASVLRGKYKNEGNDQYIEKLIQRIQEI